MRIEITKRVIKLFILVICLPILWACESKELSISVNGKSYTEGTDFRLLKTPLSLTNRDTPNVIEVFWYGCSHCESFESELHPWVEQLPQSVTFERSPALWSPVMLVHARVYYVAQALNLDHDFHMHLFDKVMSLRNSNDEAYHKNQITELFLSQGVSVQEFDRIYSSEEVAKQVSVSNSIMKKAAIQSTPTIIINGQYVLTGVPFKSKQEFLSVALFLIDDKKFK